MKRMGANEHGRRKTLGYNSGSKPESGCGLPPWHVAGTLFRDCPGLRRGLCAHGVGGAYLGVCLREATVTDLADYSFRTKGTISKMLRKLEDKGLVEKFQREGNRKCIYVQPTERGKRANDIHRAYDRAATSVMLADLLKTCTIEEVESFFKVTQARIKYLSKEQASSEQ